MNNDDRVAERKKARPAVLSVAFPYAPMGPRAVGGAEVVCSLLEAATEALEFASVVVAHEASEPHGRLYGTTIPPGLITDEVRVAVARAHQANIDRALRENEVALVHMHGLDFQQYRIPEDIPVLVTLHLPPSWYPQSLWALPAQYRLVCVSESQRKACPEGARTQVMVVENGVPLPSAATLRQEGRYALMLARICEEKNLHLGLDAARLAGMPVLLGGDTFPYEAHQRYFAEQIAPRLTASGEAHESKASRTSQSPAARFVGPVAGEEKRRLLERAACLLLPSLAPETSSLVAMEALAAGVPVIGMRVGAVPEIVEDGRTGFVLDPGEGATERMAACLGRLGEIDRKTCRAAAEERFSAETMILSYGKLYRELAAEGTQARERSGSEAASDSTQNRDESAAASVDAVPLVRPEELRLKVVTEDDRLSSLGEEWAALWASDRGTTPFQHPAWLLPWWRQFGPDGRLCALLLRHPQGRLAGLLPVYTYQPSEEAERQLLLIGAGTTDYLDGVWAPWAEGAAERALQHARTALDGWDVAALQQLRQGSLLHLAGRRAGLTIGGAEPCSVLSAAGDLPAKVRQNLHRYRRMAERQGELCCEVVQDAPAALDAFARLVRFHGERWQARGEQGVLHDSRVLAHHHESLPLLLQAGLLRLFRLTLCGKTVGILYGLADGGHVPQRRLYLYLIGFDRGVAALSPGSLLLQGAWEYARAHGFACLDLLRGGEAYKRLWGAQTEATASLTFTPERG